MTKSVVVGLSGGVDSSVSALLLKQSGFDVHAVFMQNWEEEGSDCHVEQDLADAQTVAKQIGIPFHAVNFSQDYWHNVFEHFLNEYSVGRTPNPDVLCNKEIKFNVFLKHAQSLNANYIATGHYAKLSHTGSFAKLYRPIDQQKDQTYFLYAVNQQALKHTLFPLSDLTKTEVREIAKTHRLVTSQKKDSTGICFIGPKKFRSFLREYCLAKPGPIIDINHRQIGQHQGLMFYTIGQREGLQIGGLKNAKPLPWFVAQKDVNSNSLMVVQGTNHPLLYAQGCICTAAHWTSGQTPQLPIHVAVKTRYRQPLVPATLSLLDDNRYSVQFAQPIRAITPGQACVFYQGEECLGGATIDAASNTRSPTQS